MEGFQKLVLYAAIIILIITLVVIGVALSKANSNVLWPPMTPECPDYWAIQGTGDASVCANIKSLGSCTTPTEGSKFYTKNFNTSQFTGAQGLCNKYNWATKSCNVTWDGITYGVSPPDCSV